ncbi:MAG: hypothetical protein AB7E26_13815 [Chryseobacterium sp.]
MQKLSFLLILLVFVSCTTKINQYIRNENNVNKRHGKWEEEYSSDKGKLMASGKYKMGRKIKIWKIYLDDKLYEKNRFRKNMTKTKRYYADGKLMEKGQSKMDVSANEQHWYYFGDWKYYDEKGKLGYIKKYVNGEKTDSISFKK